MLSIPVNKLRDGMVIAQSIYSKTGVAFLVKGKSLTLQYINRLKKIGIGAISVMTADPSFDVEPPEDVVQEKTRLEAIQIINDVFDDISNKKAIDAERLGIISDRIVKDVFARSENLVQLTDIRLHDPYTFAHSVNVAVLSAIIGKGVFLPEDTMRVLVMGGLLHDLGKITVPADILNKPGRLTNEEFDKIKLHPMEGCNRIREFKWVLPKASILAAIAAQHHEHMDGSGYPQGLSGGQIHKLAKIVAIADVYDALTSERPYKKAYTPSVAYSIMHTTKGHLDDELMESFFDNVAIYPVGTVLQTTFGYGIVTECEFGHTRTPTVRIFANKKRSLLRRPITMDLKNEPPDTIEKEISGNDLMAFTHDLSIDPSKYLN